MTVNDGAVASPGGGYGAPLAASPPRTRRHPRAASASAAARSACWIRRPKNALNAAILLPVSFSRANAASVSYASRYSSGDNTTVTRYRPSGVISTCGIGLWRAAAASARAAM